MVLEVGSVRRHDFFGGLVRTRVSERAMRRETSCSGEDLGVLAESIGRDQTAATAAHYPGMVAVRIDGIHAIYKRFEFLYEETQVGIALRFPVRIDRRAFRQVLDDVIVTELPDTLRSVVNSHDDSRTDATEGDE